eukprot:TRINITY_DN22605_c0_g1_i5.p1 TRINITY_DN22605_c0_g1~~TRINITY_DN22605_c0_g1_i5.p1  ORF type:complete len:578 (+),score=133.16 TRINITY_DN22605_c0_g1_i5:3-1736(+)
MADIDIDQLLEESLVQRTTVVKKEEVAPTPDTSTNEKEKPKENEKEKDKESKRKRSKSRSTSRDRKRHKSDSHRSRDRDKEKEREKDKEKDKEREKDRDKDKDRKDKEREKDRDKDKDRKDKEREKDRDKDRERDKEREKDRDKDREKDKRRSSRDTEKDRHREKDRDKERERDRDRDRDRRDRDRDRERDRDRDRRDKDRERDRERDRDTSKRKSSDRDDKRRSPRGSGERKSGERRSGERKTEDDNVDDVTRGARTVFAYNLPTKASTSEVWKFFEKAGKVRDVRLIKDRNSRRSKGFGYIEMDSINSVTNAIQLSGTQLNGKTVMVQASQHERNETPSTTTTISTKQQPTRLYVGNLPSNITAEDIQDIFGEFGEVDDVELHRDPESGVSLGFSFVQFRDPEAAKRALVQVNGHKLAGSAIKVGLVNNTSSKAATGDLDEEGGLSLDAQSRAALMAKLHRKEDPDDVMEEPIIPKAPIITPSSCIVLQNMFEESDTKEADWEVDLCADVRDECSKYGNIISVRVHKQSGLVYLRFDNPGSAHKAQADLSGRWFGGKMLTCESIAEQAYLQMWPN